MARLCAHRGCRRSADAGLLCTVHAGEPDHLCGAKGCSAHVPPGEVFCSAHTPGARGIKDPSPELEPSEELRRAVCTPETGELWEVEETATCNAVAALFIRGPVDVAFPGILSGYGKPLPNVKVAQSGVYPLVEWQVPCDGQDDDAYGLTRCLWSPDRERIGKACARMLRSRPQVHEVWEDRGGVRYVVLSSTWADEVGGQHPWRLGQHSYRWTALTVTGPETGSMVSGCNATMGDPDARLYRKVEKGDSGHTAKGNLERLDRPPVKTAES